MRKTRVIALLAATIMMVVLFASCQASPSPQSTSTPTPTPTQTPTQTPDNSQNTPEPVTLKWALWDWEATVYYQPLIDAYTTKNPHVTIEYVDLGSADYMVNVGTQLSGGADFDIVTIKDIPGYANLVRQNHLEPLNSYISSAGIDKAAYGGTLEQLEVGGEIYTLPFRSDFWIIFYNKRLFDDAGVAYPTNDMTLDQYDALARQMTSGSGPDKIYGAHYHTWRSAVQLFGILDGKNTIVDGTYDFLKPYYERILNQQKDGIVQDYATLKTTSTHYSGVFYNEQIAMMNMGSWFIATQIQKVKEGESKATEWGIVKYPHPDGVAAGTTLGTITGSSVSSKSANKDAAFDFVNFIGGAEGAAVMAGVGQFPAISDDNVLNIISSIDGFPQDAASKEALKTSKLYLEMPLHDKSADIEIILNECHDAIMTGNSTIDDAIAKMNTRVKAVLG